MARCQLPHHGQHQSQSSKTCSRSVSPLRLLRKLNLKKKKKGVSKTVDSAVGTKREQLR